MLMRQARFSVKFAIAVHSFSLLISIVSRQPSLSTEQSGQAAVDEFISALIYVVNPRLLHGGPLLFRNLCIWINAKHEREEVKNAISVIADQTNQTNTSAQNIQSATQFISEIAAQNISNFQM